MKDFRWIEACLMLAFVARTSLAATSFSKAPLQGSHRQGKFLFNIIRFRNDPCNTTDSLDQVQGLCFTTSECSARGGVGRGTCAAGFGICCVVDKTCYGVGEEKLMYFRNPSYPLEDGITNYCTFSIKVRDRDVCQVRLDFLRFKMSPPSMTSAPFGQCSADRMAVFASQNKLGLSEGNLLCGDMTGQHIYIPTDASNGEDSVSLFAMVGTASFTNTSTNYTWNIMAEQIDCTLGLERQAPAGCLQYFTSISGTLESFNFSDKTSPYPILLDYAICIKRRPGFCGLVLNTMTVGDEFGLNINNVGLPSATNVTDDACHGTEENVNDFIQLLGASTKSNDGMDSVSASYFCGIFRPGSDHGGDTFRGITASFLGPIVIRFTTDKALTFLGSSQPATSPLEAEGIVGSGGEIGFRLSYTVTPNCPN